MTATEQTTLADFIAEHGITMTAEPRDSNPNMEASYDMHHWTCRLRYGRKRMSIPFSQGSAIYDEPTAADVLNCLALDASGIENARDFDDWCGDYGYDTDSRKAEHTFKVCERQAAKLMQFLGVEAYDVLVFHTESL